MFYFCYFNVGNKNGIDQKIRQVLCANVKVSARVKTWDNWKILRLNTWKAIVMVQSLRVILGFWLQSIEF